MSPKDLIGGLKRIGITFRDNIQCWSGAKDYVVGNCKDIEEGVGNVKKR